MVEGYDEHLNKESRLGGSRSYAGASWVFSWEQLRETGAFLTADMNGERLTAHHGAPLRLVVPSFYGCASIKWVNRVSVVEGGATPPTSQMREFRGRVHMGKASKTDAVGQY